jgi:hypothetical protein
MAVLRIVLLALLVALATPAAIAAEAPMCVAANAGTVACIAERLCRCAFQRGGSMVDRDAGYRWDCGALRPNCHRPPATVQRPAQPFTGLDLLLPLRDGTPWPRPRPPVHPAPPATGPVR